MDIKVKPYTLCPLCSRDVWGVVQMVVFTAFGKPFCLKYLIKNFLSYQKLYNQQQVCTHLSSARATEITVANLRVVNLLKAFVSVLAAYPRGFTVAKGHNGAFAGRLALATDCKLKCGM